MLLGWSILALNRCSTSPSLNNGNNDNDPAISEPFAQEAFLINKSLSNYGHPAGSINQEKITKFIGDWLKKRAFIFEIQAFDVLMPNRLNQTFVRRKGQSAFTQAALNQVESTPKKLSNIIVSLEGASTDTILLGSHYDTKDIEGMEYLGANDSGSSTAFLMVYLKKLRKMQSKGQLKFSYLIVFFDGEEAILPDWYDGEKLHPFKQQDNTYGSRHFAGVLKKQTFISVQQKKFFVKAAIIFDMVGSHNLAIQRDQNSSSELFDLFSNSARKLHARRSIKSNPFILGSIAIEDDHIPFKKLGIAVLDLIDFTNIQNWHKKTDTIDRINQQNFEVLEKITTTTLPQVESRLK